MHCQPAGSRRAADEILRLVANAVCTTALACANHRQAQTVAFATPRTVTFANRDHLALVSGARATPTRPAYRSRTGAANHLNRAVVVVTVSELVTVVVDAIIADFEQHHQAGDITRAVRVRAVGQTIAVVVDGVVTTLHGRLTTATSSDAVAVVAVQPTVSIVVDAIIAHLRTNRCAGCVQHTIFIETVDEQVAIIVDTIRAIEFGVGDCTAGDKGAVAVITVGQTIAVVICAVSAQLRVWDGDAGEANAEVIHLAHQRVARDSGARHLAVAAALGRTIRPDHVGGGGIIADDLHLERLGELRARRAELQHRRSKLVARNDQPVPNPDGDTNRLRHRARGQRDLTTIHLCPTAHRITHHHRRRRLLAGHRAVAVALPRVVNATEGAGEAGQEATSAAAVHGRAPDTDHPVRTGADVHAATAAAAGSGVVRKRRRPAAEVAIVALAAELAVHAAHQTTARAGLAEPARSGRTAAAADIAGLGTDEAIVVARVAGPSSVAVAAGVAHPVGQCSAAATGVAGLRRLFAPQGVHSVADKAARAALSAGAAERLAERGEAAAGVLAGANTDQLILRRAEEEAVSAAAIALDARQRGTAAAAVLRRRAHAARHIRVRHVAGPDAVAAQAAACANFHGDAATAATGVFRQCSHAHWRSSLVATDELAAAAAVGRRQQTELLVAGGRSAGINGRVGSSVGAVGRSVFRHIAARAVGACVGRGGVIGRSDLLGRCFAADDENGNAERERQTQGAATAQIAERQRQIGHVRSLWKSERPSLDAGPR